MDAYQNSKDDAEFEGKFPQAKSFLVQDNTVSPENAMLDPEFGKEKHEEMDTSNSPQGAMSEAINEDGEDH